MKNTMKEVSDRMIEIMGLKEELESKKQIVSERDDETLKLRGEMDELNTRISSMRKEVKEVSQRLNSKEEENKKLQLRIKSLESKTHEKKRKLSIRVSSSEAELRTPDKNPTRQGSKTPVRTPPQLL